MATTTPGFEEFLEAHLGREMLRFTTAGSVDDGKSTLIGRLLHDTKSVYEDQLAAVKKSRVNRASGGHLDFSLLTDGLKAEREQGITIDVAYRYFSTARRKFIIADTPGHEQYTRNMDTGASTADAAIVLIDASKGVQIQSRRHAYIASLLGVRHVIVAVNKMDLVGYSEEVFRKIQREFEEFLKVINSDGQLIDLYSLPVSALLGVNVTSRSEETPWYNGPSLLELLESLPRAEDTSDEAFRFPVQRVVRPDQNFRGFAGQIASGSICVGDPITVLPSGRTSHVARIVTYDGDLKEAAAPLSVTLTLEDELDISRGDLMVCTGEEAQLSRRFAASLVWMDGHPLDPERRYLLKHASHTVPVPKLRVRYRVDVDTLQQLQTETLSMNEIGLVEVETRRPIGLDRYAQIRGTGSFVLIDHQTNATVAAGMVREIYKEEPRANRTGPVTPAQRTERWGHEGEVVELNAPPEIADALEHALFDLGAVTVRALRRNPGMHAAMATSGIIVLVHHESTPPAHLKIGESPALEIDTSDIEDAVASILQQLRARGILQS